jgi:hypothetical protein
MPTGTVTTYDLTTGVIVDIDPLIRLLDPTDVPLQNGAGSDGRSVLSTGTTFEKRFDWQDETILIPRSTAAATATTGGGVLTVASGHQLRFSTGDALLIGAEQVRVTAYGNTADTLLISRGYADTSAGTIASGTDIVNLGANLAEGSDPQNARSLDWSSRYNLTQIFGPTAVVVSGTENAIRKYGLVGTMFDKQAANRMAEEAIKLEQALLYGTRYDDTSGKIRQMGGMSYFITTNVNSSTTEISLSSMLDLAATIYDLGGAPNRLLVGALQKRRISALDGDDIRLGRQDNGRGQTVDYFDSDFGRWDIVMHRRVRATDAFLFNRDQATIRTLRPFQFEMLGKTGDSEKGIIVGEKTLQFNAQRWAGRFSALT